MGGVSLFLDALQFFFAGFQNASPLTTVTKKMFPGGVFFWRESEFGDFEPPPGFFNVFDPIFDFFGIDKSIFP